MESRNQVIYKWLLDWVLYQAFEEFRESHKVETVDRDLIQAIIKYHTDVEPSDQISQRNTHLLVILCKLTDGEEFSTKYENVSNYTVLEEVIEMMDAIIDTEEIKYNNLLAALKQQAVYVCCRGGDFVTAEEVFKRQWTKPRNKTERITAPAVQAVLKLKKTNHVQLRDNTYREFCTEFVKLIEPQDPTEPFLLKTAWEAIENKNITSYDIKACGVLLRRLQDQFNVAPDSSNQENEPIVERKINEVRRNKEKSIRRLISGEMESDEDEDYGRNRNLTLLSTSKTSTPRGKKNRMQDKQRSHQSNSAKYNTTLRKRHTEKSSDSESDDVRPLRQRVVGSSMLKKSGVNLSMSFSDSDEDSSFEFNFDIKDGSEPYKYKKRVKTKSNQRKLDKDGFLEPTSLPPGKKNKQTAGNMSTCSFTSSMSRRTVNPWNKKETAELYQGVKRFGVGRWAEIKAHSNLPRRTNVNCKDRWRSMIKDRGLMAILAAKYGSIE